MRPGANKQAGAAMGAHPWKAEDLVVDDELEEADDWFQELVDQNQFCDCCGELDAMGDCACSDWDDDCWVAVARSPWSTRWDRPVHALSAKGKRLRAEVRAETRDFINALDRRANIRKARRHWMVLKDAVDAKRIALYWQEQTQCRLCAPGGAGRAADAAAFQDEF